ncbi:hypothetical protein ACWD25_01710 [Streptomyces sp. NPDC002920]
MPDPQTWHELVNIFSNSGQAKGSEGGRIPTPADVTAPQWTQAYWNRTGGAPFAAPITWTYPMGTVGPVTGAPDGSWTTAPTPVTGSAGLAIRPELLNGDSAWWRYDVGSLLTLNALDGQGTDTTSPHSLERARDKLTATINYFTKWEPNLNTWQGYLQQDGWQGLAASSFGDILKRIATAYKTILDTASGSGLDGGYIGAVNEALTALWNARNSMKHVYAEWKSQEAWSPEGAMQVYGKDLVVFWWDDGSGGLIVTLSYQGTELGRIDDASTWTKVDEGVKKIWTATAAKYLDEPVAGIVSPLTNAYQKATTELRELNNVIRTALTGSPDGQSNDGGKSIQDELDDLRKKAAGGGEGGGEGGGTGGAGSSGANLPPPGSTGAGGAGGGTGGGAGGGTGGGAGSSGADLEPPGLTGGGAGGTGGTGSLGTGGGTGGGTGSSGASLQPPGLTGAGAGGTGNLGAGGGTGSGTSGTPGTSGFSAPDFGGSGLPDTGQTGGGSGQSGTSGSGLGGTTGSSGPTFNTGGGGIVPPLGLPPGSTGGSGSTGSTGGTGALPPSGSTGGSSYPDLDLDDFEESPHLPTDNLVTPPPGSNGTNGPNIAAPGSTFDSSYPTYNVPTLSEQGFPATSSTNPGSGGADDTYGFTPPALSSSGGADDGYLDAYAGQFLDSNGNAGDAGAGAGSGASAQTPYLPPMGGMGGMGGGAGGGDREKERERTTWLAEDAEVWGTDPELAPTVLGRTPQQNAPLGGIREQQPVPGAPGRGPVTTGRGPRPGRPGTGGAQGGQRDGNVQGSPGQRNG